MSARKLWRIINLIPAGTITGPHLTRRRFLSFGLTGAVVAGLAACTAGSRERNSLVDRYRRRSGGQWTGVEGRLSARPAQPDGPAPLGQHRLGLEPKRDGWLYVPAGYQAGQPAPLAVMLHGSGGNAEHGLRLFRDLADSTGIILLAPDSRGRTWDIIMDDYGPDIVFMDKALAQTFSNYAVDPAHIAIGGFSDGASYALSVGLMNGDLFSHIIAFSPGFLAPAVQQGAPQIYISHGTEDTVLPIGRCSRRIVPAIQEAGYDVHYHEFEGPHTVPPDIIQEAAVWFTV